MRAIKAFKQSYSPTPEINQLLETFRLMANICIRIGLRSNKTSRNALSKLCYHELSPFRLHTWYRLYVISVAVSALKNYRKALRKGLNPKKPYICEAFAQIGSQAFKVEDGKLRLPLGPKEWFYIPLSSYILKNISDPTFKLGSVAITARTVVITVSKNAELLEPTGYVGIDVNEDRAIAASSDGEIKEYDFNDVPRIISTYREVVSRFKRNDVRVRREIAGKYGAKRRNRAVQRLHRISKTIVTEANEKKQAIVLEKLTNIRNRHRRGNNESRRFRHRLNSWPFRELQRQIEYKAAWHSIPVIYVNPSQTSRICPVCGKKVPKGRIKSWLVCPSCHLIFDGHEAAARNILSRGARFAPVGPPIEAMVPERDNLIRKVDGGKVTDSSPDKLPEPSIFRCSSKSV